MTRINETRVNLSEAMELINSAYQYAHRQLDREPLHGETLPLYDVIHATCLDWACWIAEAYPNGDCDMSLHFWPWLEKAYQATR